MMLLAPAPVPPHASNPKPYPPPSGPHITSYRLAQGEAFGYILDLTGGVTGSLTSFVLPAFIYLKGSEQQSRSREGRWGYRLASKILLVFGAALILVVLSSVFHNPFATFIISAVVLSGLFSVRATITAP